MALRGQWGIGREHRCSYLPEQTARMELLRVSMLGEPEFEALMTQGYRHFGDQFFRPCCAACHACVPLRVCTVGFRASRSVRKAFGRAGSLTAEVTAPCPSQEAYELYCRHKERFRDTNPEMEPVSYDDFVRAFFHPFPFSRTLVIRQDGRLVAVSHLDLTGRLLSAVYCYYDVRDLALSPGRLAIYLEIALAAHHAVPHVHLGYYIAANRHMRYKAGFMPSEVLLGQDQWVPFMDATRRCLLDPERLAEGFRPPGKPRFTQVEERAWPVQEATED
jgi:arginine-tRNA-protein transferase